MAVLYVDEQISIERQLARGRHAKEHNEKVRQTGIGALLEVRATDQSEQVQFLLYESPSLPLFLS